MINTNLYTKYLDMNYYNYALCSSPLQQSQGEGVAHSTFQQEVSTATGGMQSSCSILAACMRSGTQVYISDAVTNIPIALVWWITFHRRFFFLLVFEI